jgi:hypothetical protein
MRIAFGSNGAVEGFDDRTVVARGDKRRSGGQTSQQDRADKKILAQQLKSRARNAYAYHDATPDTVTTFLRRSFCELWLSPATSRANTLGVPVHTSSATPPNIALIGPFPLLVLGPTATS